MTDPEAATRSTFQTPNSHRVKFLEEEKISTCLTESTKTGKLWGRWRSHGTLTPEPEHKRTCACAAESYRFKGVTVKDDQKLFTGGVSLTGSSSRRSESLQKPDPDTTLLYLYCQQYTYSIPQKHFCSVYDLSWTQTGCDTERQTGRGTKRENGPVARQHMSKHRPSVTEPNSPSAFHPGAV